MRPGELTFRGNRVVSDGRVISASVHVNDGVISRISAYDDVGDQNNVVECGNNVLMAGLVDSHVHVNEPGRTEWEGFETATRAAAAGGITTIVDMPLNSIPATVSVAALEEKLQSLEGKCHVDVGLWGGAVRGNQDQLEPLLKAGVLGFKCFLVDSGVEEFSWLDRGELRKTLDILSKTGAPLLVHAELAEGLHPQHGDPRRYDTFLASRPPRAEDLAINLLFEMNRSSRASVHVVHLSSAASLDTLRRARDQNVPLSAETTPHYLHLSAEKVPDGGTEFKCAPPIREASNREALWKGLSEGLIDCVVSDHSPCTPELKRRAEGDFKSAWGGIASLQLVLPIVWTEVRSRSLGLERLPAWLSEGPAELARLSSKKGRIAPGCDADFVVWNPEEAFTVDATRLQHRNKITPYDGETLFGVVKETWLRGERIFNGGEFGRRSGRWLRGG